MSLCIAFCSSVFRYVGRSLVRSLCFYFASYLFSSSVIYFLK